VLAIQERVMGPEHSDTLGTRQHLALVLLAQGRHAECEEEFRSLLAAQAHLYGSEAAETFRTRQRLAYVQYCQRKYTEAIASQQMALAVAKKEGGDGGRRQTAEAYFALSRYELFARDFAAVLADSEAGLALDPAYLSLLAKRAHAYLFLGQIREAEQIYRAHRGEIIDAKSNRTWEQVVLKDFDELEKSGLTCPEVARIRELLKTDVK
jgi:tetratricopeptide (TPR) repeat protein